MKSGNKISSETLAVRSQLGYIPEMNLRVWEKNNLADGQTIREIIEEYESIIEPSKLVIYLPCYMWIIVWTLFLLSQDKGKSASPFWDALLLIPYLIPPFLWLMKWDNKRSRNTSRKKWLGVLLSKFRNDAQAVVDAHEGNTSRPINTGLYRAVLVASACRLLRAEDDYGKLAKCGLSTRHATSLANGEVDRLKGNYERLWSSFIIFGFLPEKENLRQYTIAIFADAKRMLGGHFHMRS